MLDIATTIRTAKEASRGLASITTEVKDRALEAMASALGVKAVDLTEVLK